MSYTCAVHIDHIQHKSSSHYPLGVPRTLPPHVFCSFICILFCFIITHCPVPPAYTQVQGSPLEHRQLITTLTPEKSISLSSHQSPIATHVAVKPHEPLSHLLQSVYWLAFVQLATVHEDISPVMYSRQDSITLLFTTSYISSALTFAIDMKV